MVLIIILFVKWLNDVVLIHLEFDNDRVGILDVIFDNTKLEIVDDIFAPPEIDAPPEVDKLSEVDTFSVEFKFSEFNIQFVILIILDGNNLENTGVLDGWLIRLHLLIM